MLPPLLLASAFALAAPAVAQDMTDNLTPPDATPGTVTTNMDEPMAGDAMEHDMEGTLSTTDDTDVDDTDVSDTMTTATTAESMPDTDVAPDTTTMPTTAAADAEMSTTPTTTGTFTGMGGPIDIQSQWSSFDTVGDGLLTPLEFARWVASSMGQPMAGDPADQAVELLNASADELALVDTNDDWHVSRDELTAAAPQ